jgi:CheY-like chemotaxis protein
MSRRILVIEDDADGEDAVCTLLTVWGHRVVSAETGQRGIELILVEAPDVIVLDLGLGDVDGCDVIRRIRSERPGNGPWIIVYSGYHLQRDRAWEAGCDAFVLKPGIDELRYAIDGAGERGTLPAQASKVRDRNTLR